jgi:GNAT superfamily N-acetyltransferase
MPALPASTAFSIGSDYLPGIMGRIVEMHAHYCARHWGFGSFFEAKIAADIAEFHRALPHPDARLWHALDEDRVVGSVGVDGRHAAEIGAHLRWFIIDDRVRGTGLGKRLLSEALGFARERAYANVYLWTFAGLEAARHLYESRGFHLVGECEATTWGARVTEQRFLLELTDKRSVRQPAGPSQQTVQHVNQTC